MMASLLRTISPAKATFAGPTNFPDSKTAQAFPTASRRPARFGVTATMIPAIATATEVTPNSTSPYSRPRYNTRRSMSSSSSSAGTLPLTTDMGHCASIAPHAILVAHHPIDQIGSSYDPGALRDQVRLIHVEQLEIAGACVKFGTEPVRVFDKIIH